MLQNLYDKDRLMPKTTSSIENFVSGNVYTQCAIAETVMPWHHYVSNPEDLPTYS